MKNHKSILSNITLFTLLIFSSHFDAEAQVKPSSEIAQRFFVPAIQMGYINHNSDNMSDGIMIQTSMEYRTRKNLLFRGNYDYFRGRLNVITNSNQTYSAKIPLSELIGGIGYRVTKKRHNLFLVAQTGIRFYEEPVIENFNGNLNIDQKDETIGTFRYTLGYEYEVFNSVFLNTEIFTGHLYDSKDFWENTKPFYGITFGISSKLFW
ncbi:MAG: hypothetical protein ACKOXF_07235 [Chitinophagaceae bacterium]